MPATSPADYTGIAFWLPTGFGKSMFKQSSDLQISSNAAAHGDTVGVIDEVIGGFRVEATSAGSSPTLALLGTHSSALRFTTAQRLQIINSKSALRFLHIAQLGEVLFWIKFTNGTTGTNEVIFDCNDLTSGGSSAGVSVYRAATTGIMTAFLTRGAASSNVAVNITGPAITDTAWHMCRVKFKPGASACVLYVDGVAGTAGTITGAVPAAGTDAIFDYAFGEKSSSQSSRMAADLGDFILIDGEMAAGDLTHFSSYNPTFSTTAYAHKALAATASLTPNQHTNLFSWFRLTDPLYVRKDATAAGVAGATVVTANADKVHGVANLKTVYTGGHFSRDMVQTGADGICPVWTTALVNGLAGVVWAGNATDPATDNYANENNLTYPQWGYGAKTWLWVARNTDNVVGSHYARATNAGYAVQTGTDYLAHIPIDRGDFLIHTNSQVLDSAVLPHPEGINTYCYRQQGNVGQFAYNGHWGPLVTPLDNFIPIHMGRPKNPLFDLKGSVFESAMWNCWMANPTIDKMARPMIARLAPQPYQYSGSQRRGAMGLGGNLSLSM